MKKWWVYIIEAENGNLYTGITTDIKRRLEEHKKGKLGAKFFRSSAPKKILFQEHFPDRSSASKREAQIKSWKREKKIKLIQGSL